MNHLVLDIWIEGVHGRGRESVNGQSDEKIKSDGHNKENAPNEVGGIEEIGGTLTDIDAGTIVFDVSVGGQRREYTAESEDDHECDAHATRKLAVPGDNKVRDDEESGGVCA